MRPFLYHFYLIELNGDDLRRDPLAVRKATLASLLPRGAPGLRFRSRPVISVSTFARSQFSSALQETAAMPYRPIAKASCATQVMSRN